MSLSEIYRAREMVSGGASWTSQQFLTGLAIEASGFGRQKLWGDKGRGQIQTPEANPFSRYYPWARLWRPGPSQRPDRGPAALCAQPRKEIRTPLDMHHLLRPFSNRLPSAVLGPKPWPRRPDSPTASRPASLSLIGCGITNSQALRQAPISGKDSQQPINSTPGIL